MVVDLLQYKHVQNTKTSEIMLQFFFYSLPQQPPAGQGLLIHYVSS